MRAFNGILPLHGSALRIKTGLPPARITVLLFYAVLTYEGQTLFYSQSSASKECSSG